MKSVASLAFMLALIPGCDDASGPAADAGHDLTQRADLTAGGDLGPGADGAVDAAGPYGCADNNAVAVSGSFNSPLGGLNRVAEQGHAVVRGIDNTIDSDTVVRASAGKVYALMRQSGVVRIYDTAGCFAGPVDVPVGDDNTAHQQSDPTDLVALDGGKKLYVAAYGNDAAHAIAIVDTTLGPPAVRGWVAVPAAGSPRPRATELWSCGGLVYAFLEDLDNSFQLTGPGRVVVLDPATDAVVSDGKPAVITLAGSNPAGGFPYGVTPFDSACDDVLVADAGDLSGMGQDLGGIERVDLAGRVSRGLLWRGAADFQANIGAIASAGPHLLYATVGSASNQVVALDPTAVSKLGDVLGPAGYIPFVQVSPDHQVWIGVGFASQGQPAIGLYVAPADGKPIAGAPITFDQPPYGISFL